MLTTLPKEVQQLILYLLDGEDLANVQLTCRNLSGISQAAMWRRVETRYTGQRLRWLVKGIHTKLDDNEPSQVSEAAVSTYRSDSRTGREMRAFVGQTASDQSVVAVVPPCTDIDQARGVN